MGWDTTMRAIAFSIGLLPRVGIRLDPNSCWVALALLPAPPPQEHALTALDPKDYCPAEKGFEQEIHSDVLLYAACRRADEIGYTPHTQQQTEHDDGVCAACRIGDAAGEPLQFHVEAAGGQQLGGEAQTEAP